MSTMDSLAEGRPTVCAASCAIALVMAATLSLMVRWISAEVRSRGSREHAYSRQAEMVSALKARATACAPASGV